MKNLLFMSCMIAALVSSALSCLCYSCVSNSTTTCDHVTQIECPGGKCMTTAQFFYNGVNSYYGFEKGCAKEEMCGQEGRSTGVNIKYQSSSRCCKGNFCNGDDEYELFEEDLTPNGLVCETCYNNGGNEYCESEETIECTGNQDRCFDYCVILQNPDCSVLEYCTKGCTNTYTCENSFDCNIGLKEVRRKHLAC